MHYAYYRSRYWFSHCVLSALPWIRNAIHVSYSMSLTCRAGIWMLLKVTPVAISAGLSSQLSVLTWIRNTVHVFYCLSFTCHASICLLPGVTPVAVSARLSSQLSVLAWIRNTIYVFFCMSLTCHASVFMLQQSCASSCQCRAVFAAVSAGLDQKHHLCLLQYVSRMSCQFLVPGRLLSCLRWPGSEIQVMSPTACLPHVAPVSGCSQKFGQQLLVPGCLCSCLCWPGSEIPLMSSTVCFSHVRMPFHSLLARPATAGS